MLPLPRPELSALLPVPHGGDASPGCLDCSTGVSPLPPPAAVLEAARSADVTRYPHPTALPLRERLAAVHGVPAEGVVVGNGSAELIWALARAFAGEGRAAMVLAPAFGEYAQAARASGARVETVEAGGPPFTWREAAVLARVQAVRPSLLFLCRPSNPCLVSMPRETVEALADAAPTTLFVVDEAYQPLFEGVEPVSPGRNVVVLRSLTKVFALPGLRLGYLLGAPALCRAVQAALPPWNVSAPALAAGLVAAGLQGEVAAVRAEVARLRRGQQEALLSAGARVEAAGGTFLLCRVPGAHAFAATAVRHGLRVRDCTSFGLPQHVRVGVRPEAEHRPIAAAWRHTGESLA